SLVTGNVHVGDQLRNPEVSTAVQRIEAFGFTEEGPVDGAAYALIDSGNLLEGDVVTEGASITVLQDEGSGLRVGAQDHVDTLAGVTGVGVQRWAVVGLDQRVRDVVAQIVGESGLDVLYTLVGTQAANLGTQVAVTLTEPRTDQGAGHPFAFRH